MTEQHSTPSRLHRLIPQGKSGWIIIVGLVAFAFIMGLLIAGDGEQSETNGAAVQATAADSSSAPKLWTCSMHPQIKLPHPGKCPSCGMDLIPLESGHTEETAPNQIRLSKTAVQLVQIETSPVVRGLAERQVRMVGKITYDETRLAYITAWVPGRLDRLYADYTGISIAKGDHMVYMYSPELLSAQEELLQAAVSVKKLSNSASKILRQTAQATLEAAADKLRLYGLTNEQIQEIETTGKTTDHLTIYAPIGGVVVKQDALEGMYVKTGTRIYTIADLSELWVFFEAYESDLPWLRYGQHVSFTAASFPGETFDAIVSFIDPVVDPKTRTVKVRAVVDNHDGKLKPDMFVTGIVRSRLNAKGRVVDEKLAGKWVGPMHPEIVEGGHGACDICGMPLVPAESLGYAASATVSTDAPLLIPASAPLITGKRAVVYVEIPDEDGPLFEGREVVLGPRAGDAYVVKSGLAEGERVVTRGAFKLDSELQIQAKPSMMSPKGGVAPPGHQHGVATTPAPTGEQKPKQKAATEATKASLDVSRIATIREALVPVYHAYFRVQLALASDDLATALQGFADVGRATKNVDMSIFGSAHMKWMSLMNDISKAVAKAKDTKDIAVARDAFYDLSQATIALNDSFGHASDQPFYLTFCPMARNKQGAYWLQTKDTVFNPFYGSKMPRCGSIKKTLPGAKEKE